MEPETLPNPLFQAICGLLFPIENLPWFFMDVLLIFCHFSRARNMKNNGFSWGKRNIFTKSAFSRKLRKIVKKPPKILPKSTQNPPRIGKKSKNIDQKIDADLRCAKKNEKMQKNAKKWPKSPPKGRWEKPRRHTRSLLRRGRSPSQGRFRREVGEVAFSTRWGVGDSRALGRSAGLRETARGSWHRKSSQNLPKIFQNPSNMHQFRRHISSQFLDRGTGRGVLGDKV